MTEKMFDFDLETEDKEKENVDDLETQQRALLVLNGYKSMNLPSSSDYDCVVVCDGAYEKAEKELDKIDMVVGDFDSLGFVPTDVNTLVYPADKNLTDAELAINFLIEKGVDEVDIYWAEGFRIDHFLGNITLLKKCLDNGIVGSIKTELEEIYLINDMVELENILGKTISLLPFSESVHILSTKGLKYDASGLVLTNDQARGLSNVAISDNVEVSVEIGEALLIINK